MYSLLSFCFSIPQSYLSLALPPIVKNTRLSNDQKDLLYCRLFPSHDDRRPPHYTVTTPRVTPLTVSCLEGSLPFFLPRGRPLSCCSWPMQPGLDRYAKPKIHSQHEGHAQTQRQRQTRLTLHQIRSKGGASLLEAVTQSRK